MKRVVDASALLTGRQFPGELYTVPEAVQEVRRHGMTPPLEAILATHVRVMIPDPSSVREVRDASETTGDAHRLSPTDVALVALAREIGASIVTDDYSIQNVAHLLGVPYEGVMEPGIKERWTWVYRCTGCGATWPEWPEACPTCGSRIRTVRGSRQPR